MAKFFGVVGYGVESKETKPGVFVPVITEQSYSGDIIENSRRWQAGENQNDDLVVSNRISIVADTFADQNFYAMRYVKWIGVYWKVTKVEVQRPRLILTMGGVYNGPKGTTS